VTLSGALEGAVAVVAGGSRGIGAAGARGPACNGVAVVVNATGTVQDVDDGYLMG
jgi:NAD(P)-dependent dehydrogenase (short-subunit alcohol dehydrogenase family)